MRIRPDAETLKQTRLAMQGSLLSTILCPGLIAGLDTVRDCMKDSDIRPFLGHTLLHEIMPNLGLTREDAGRFLILAERNYYHLVKNLELMALDSTTSW